ncbi:LOW QUALITY PROTEIN: RNA-binding protein 41 [Sceloporus undulatus]|uniref:LOW QUALITY PROTEIN: RNA-binding protein 41 n=1 Tax=Sceloporus undulatus TaxID=8520 RepID=UPI001C4D2240|nr:LOW QUALITY PROTEIN: RNA-binding protein 41 [Sceloporus undulatus]
MPVLAVRGRRQGPSAMKRVSSGPGALPEEPPPPEALETEGERQLRTLLRHQLETSTSLERCLSKRARFAPASLYKPFGEEAAGTRTLTQFQALQERSQEMDALHHLGLSDAEIHLWKTHTKAAAKRKEKSLGLGAAPEATQDRIRAIEEKISERQRILALPQRFAGSKQLSRREMEIERSLFQGADRHPFLRMLYHQDAVAKDGPPAEGRTTPLETLYQEVLSPAPPTGTLSPSPSGTPSVALDSSLPSDPVTVVRRPVQFVPEEEICQNRLSEEEIRQIPRFASYAPGEPSQVLYLKNLSRRVTAEDLLSIFARFQEEGGPQVQFRLLSGRMRGQAFLTFPSISMAQAALQLANGFHLLGKPLVIEFGKGKGHATSPLEPASNPGITGTP